MKSPKISIRTNSGVFPLSFGEGGGGGAKTRRGFTLIEIMITVAIFAMLAGLGLLMSFQTYRSSNLQGEVDHVISSLLRARSQAMNNIDQTTHTVCYDSGAKQYLTTEGTCTTPVNPEIIPSGGNFTITNWPTSGITFEQLTGNTPGVTMTISDGIKTRTIATNQYGQINWQ